MMSMYEIYLPKNAFSKIKQQQQQQQILNSFSSLKPQSSAQLNDANLLSMKSIFKYD